MDLCLFTFYEMDGCHGDNYGVNLFWKSQNYWPDEQKATK